MKTSKYFLLVCLAVGQSLVAKETKFEFLNKTDKSVDVALGTRMYSPTMSSKTERIGAGGTLKEDVDTDLFPQLLIKDPYAPGMAFVYEFRDKKDKDKPVTTNIYVRLLEKSGATSFERQQNTLNNLDKENIFLIKTLGSPQAAPKAAKVTPYAILGLKDGAPDYEILGIPKSEITDKNAVKKAYQKLALIWHPDKRNTNSTAKARYAKDDVKNLSDKDKENLSNEVFKLIGNTKNKVEDECDRGRLICK